MASANAFGKMHPQQRQKMEKIAKTEGNKVLKWQWDTVNNVKSSCDIMELFVSTLDLFLQLHEQFPNESKRDLRIKLQKENEAIADFAKTNPMFFKTATKIPLKKPTVPADGNVSDEQYIARLHLYNLWLDRAEKKNKSICFMIKMRGMVERGEISQLHASQIVQQFNISLCKTEETYHQYKERLGSEALPPRNPMNDN